jgi:hypothetical protein
MTNSRASIWYRERKGHVRTARGPVPRLSPSRNLAMDYPLAPPGPDPNLVGDGPRAPDQGVTGVWPHGIDGEQPQ